MEKRNRWTPFVTQRWPVTCIYLLIVDEQSNGKSIALNSRSGRKCSLCMMAWQFNRLIIPEELFLRRCGQSSQRGQSKHNGSRCGKRIKLHAGDIVALVTAVIIHLVSIITNRIANLWDLWIDLYVIDYWQTYQMQHKSSKWIFIWTIGKWKVVQVNTKMRKTKSNNKKCWRVTTCIESLLLLLTERYCNNATLWCVMWASNQ